MTKKQSYLIYLMACVAVFFILLARQHGDLWQAPLIAEEGSLFLTDALNEPFWTNLFVPHEDYVHVAPRCVARLARIQNLPNIALLYRLTGLAIGACLLAFPLQPLFRRRMPLAVRLLLVLLAALIPWNMQIVGRLSHLHWFLFYYVAMLSIADFEEVSIVELVIHLFLLLVAVFSTPFSILCAPIFVWRYFRSRTFRSRLISGGGAVLIVGSVFSIKVFLAPLSLDVAFSELPLYTLFLVRTLGYNVICMTALGEQWTELHCQSWLACYSAWILFFALLVCCSLINGLHRKQVGRRQRSERFVYSAVLYYLLVPLLFVAVLRPSSVTAFVIRGDCGGISRYFTVSAWFLLLLVLMQLYTTAKQLNGWGTRIFLVALACAYAIVIQRNFIYPPSHAHGWYDGIQRYYNDLADETNEGYEYYYVTLRHDPPWLIKLPFAEVPEEVRSAIRDDANRP